MADEFLLDSAKYVHLHLREFRSVSEIRERTLLKGIKRCWDLGFISFSVTKTSKRSQGKEPLQLSGLQRPACNTDICEQSSSCQRYENIFLLSVEWRDTSYSSLEMAWNYSTYPAIHDTTQKLPLNLNYLLLTTRIMCGFICAVIDNQNILPNFGKRRVISKVIFYSALFDRRQGE